ncbi:MAG: ATP-binding protein [Bacillota bacterium]|nr:ATP-binding protein [Bacillota bacterium]
MKEKFTIKSEKDIRLAINSTRFIAKSLLFSEVDLQKLIVAVSELTQNVLDHAAGIGTYSYESLGKTGIKIVVQDCGGGIKQVEEILKGKSGFRKKGLGLGLAGAKRLMDDFEIESSEKGTKIIAIKWRSC